jgi:alcohol dehydrogenase
VPTTAGTGSEATRNAVLSVQGPEGFKKSFRHEQLVPQYAVVDPDLLGTCPPALIAANGMDAITQLLESYVSTRANPLTDALAIDALARAGKALPVWFAEGAKAHGAQDAMAYAALISGLNLAQTGLGAVHGLASPLGAFFPIPHGVVCGTLVAAATRVNIEALETRAPDNPALVRYATLGRLLSGRPGGSDAEARAALLRVLEDWTQYLHLPRLASYGVQPSALDTIVAHSRGSSMRTNPILLQDKEIARIVMDRL